jgi:hypothetical protein
LLRHFQAGNSCILVESLEICIFDTAAGGFVLYDFA